MIPAMTAVILPMPNVPAASPQVEDGYTRISNELLGALVLADLTKQQWEVLMAIIRKTYGFNKTEDDIALSQLSAMTDGDRGNHSRVINGLVERRILNRTKGRHSFTLGLNKDYSQWGLKAGRSDLVRAHWRGASAAPAVVTPTTENDDKGCNSYNSTVVEPTTLLLSDLQPQKTTPKETIKRQKEENTCAPQADRGESLDDARADQEDRAVTASESTRAGRKGRAVTVLTAEQMARFERFYGAYPRKRSRIAAEKAFAKLNPDDALLEDLLAGLERSKLTAQWSDPTKIPHPSSWLNAGAWEDEIETAYGAREREVIDSFNSTLGAAMGEIDPSIFTERRAGAIRTFLRLSDKPGFWTRFFPWIRDNCTLPPHAGFDWLISPDGFTKVRGGQFSKEQR